MAILVPCSILVLLFAAAAAAATLTPEILLPLIHSFSNSPRSTTTIRHLLKSSSSRSAARFHYRTHRRRQLPLPLSSGSDYTLSLSLPPSPAASLFLDTGSDLVWLPCSPFECILCDEGGGKPAPAPIPPPLSSTPLPCSSPACSAAHSLPSSNLCAISRCPLDSIETLSCGLSHPCPPLYYAYGDGSLIARLRSGPLSLSPSLPLLPNFTFACSHSSLAEPVGVAGFGPGPLSLPSQLSSRTSLPSKSFSYCLVSHSFRRRDLRRPSPLILGRLPPADPAFTYTPVLPNPRHPYFYTVALHSITLGSARIPCRSDLKSVDRHGNGGVVVDSGTTYTMLPSYVYSKLVTEFASQMGQAGFERAGEVESETGLGPCYSYDGADRAERRRVPRMEMRFGGNATVALPARNYFLGFRREGRGVGCLVVMDGGMVGGEGEGGPAGTLGNFQQQGFEVVYDVEGGRVGFARRRCAAMWESLTRE